MALFAWWVFQMKIYKNPEKEIREKKIMRKKIC